MAKSKSSQKSLVKKKSREEVKSSKSKDVVKTAAPLPKLKKEADKKKKNETNGSKKGSPGITPQQIPSSILQQKAIDDTGAPAHRMAAKYHRTFVNPHTEYGFFFFFFKNFLSPVF